MREYSVFLQASPESTDSVSASIYSHLGRPCAGTTTISYNTMMNDRLERGAAEFLIVGLLRTGSMVV